MRLLFRLIAAFAALLAAFQPASAQRLTALAPAPDWSRLEVFQETITRDEFRRLLDTVYAPGNAAAGVIEIRETDALIRTRLNPPETFPLRFAPDAKRAKPVRRFWRPAARLGPARKTKPLAGLRIILDPGHLGGIWGLMEERSFARPGDRPVQEGDMTLLVAQHAAAQLRQLGADVTLLRSKPGPITPFKVETFYPAARQELELLGVADIREKYDGPRDPQKMNTVQWQAEKLLYRVAEIRERARRVNQKFQPDLVICIHFNADDWHDPAAPVFTAANDLHTLVHGCYSTGELRYDDQRFEMLLKLLNRSHAEELAAAGPITAALAKVSGLPPYAYTTGNAVRVNDDPYLWARNLLANRIFECPVVFLEPYRMNHEETYARIQAGDYAGEREVAGKMRRSIFREYARGLVEGVRAYYAAARRK